MLGETKSYVASYQKNPKKQVKSYYFICTSTYRLTKKLCTLASVTFKKWQALLCNVPIVTSKWLYTYDLTQMTLLRWSTGLVWSWLRLLHPYSFGFIFSSDGSICSTMAFPPLQNLDVVISVSNGFPSNSKEDAIFHPIDYDYSHADFCDFGQSVSHADFKQSLWSFERCSMGVYF